MNRQALEEEYEALNNRKQSKDIEMKLVMLDRVKNLNL